MSRRMRKPDTCRLELSRGDWLLVKRHLTAGEYRQMMGRMVTQGVSTARFDNTKVALCKCVAYLLDWSIEDADGAPAVIADQSPEHIEAALDALDVESFQEIWRAIEAHEDAMEAAVKNETDGENRLPATSPSRA